MTEFEQSKVYLLAILRTYKNRTVIVKFTKNGPAHIAIKTRAVRELARFSIPFPFEEINTSPAYRENVDIDAKKLTVILEEAVLEYMESYLDDPTQHGQMSEAYEEMVRTYIEDTYDWLDDNFGGYTEEELEPFRHSEEDGHAISQEEYEEDKEVKQNDKVAAALEKLKAYGHKKMEGYDDMDRILWDLAYRHMSVDKEVVDALMTITDEPRLKKAIVRTCHTYNTLINRNRMAEVGSISVTDIKPQYISIKDHEEEIRKVKREALRTQRRLLQEQGTGIKGYKEVSRRFVGYLWSPETRYGSTFDMTKEEDVDEYIMWHRLIGRKIKNNTIKLFNEKFGYPEYFNAKVEEYNKTCKEEKATKREESLEVAGEANEANEE